MDASTESLCAKIKANLSSGILAFFTYHSCKVHMGIFIVQKSKTNLFDIGHLNILQDSHKYLVQYMFLHFHRQGHIWLIV